MIEEQILVNLVFCHHYKLTISDGVILGALNGGQNKATVEQLVEALPLLCNKKEALLKKLKNLKEKKIIFFIKYSDEEVYNTLKKGIFSNNSCQFCGLNDIILHKHHYPIRRKENGKKVINLCPNCHTRFHMMADYDKKYVFNPRYKKEWNYSEEEWYEKIGKLEN